MSFRPFYVNGPSYGGLVGDIQDAARFLALHLGGGAANGHRLLSAESAAAMRTLTITGAKLTTGLGWWRRHEEDDGSGLVEHFADPPLLIWPARWPPGVVPDRLTGMRLAGGRIWLLSR